MCTNIVHCFEILFPFILGIHPQRECSIIDVSSTVGEKDPSDEKTDTYNLASGESGGPPALHGRKTKWLLSARTLLAEVT